MQIEPMTAPRPQRQACSKGSAGTALAVPNLTAMLAATIVLVLSMNGGAVAEPPYSFDTTPGRLPKTVVPTHYAIELTPDLEHLTTAGVEVVDVEVREPTARLVLNAVDMTLSAASIDDETQRAEVALDAATETATLSFARPLAAGPHRLRIGFAARINSFARGLFFVDYPTGNGTKRMLSSHLEPADARRIFPSGTSPPSRRRLHLMSWCRRRSSRSAICRSRARNRSRRT
jgi:Peptidase M1 N-terminal domain